LLDAACQLVEENDHLREEFRCSRKRLFLTFTKASTHGSFERTGRR
jgi:hypothetical protein